MAITHGRIESPWIAFGVVVAACLGFVCWHAYQRDPEDPAWNKADVPPPMAALSPTPGNATPETPAGVVTSEPMRYRRYPASLFSSSVSIIGSF